MAAKKTRPKRKTKTSDPIDPSDLLWVKAEPGRVKAEQHTFARHFRRPGVPGAPAHLLASEGATLCGERVDADAFHVAKEHGSVPVCDSCEDAFVTVTDRRDDLECSGCGKPGVTRRELPPGKVRLEVLHWKGGRDVFVCEACIATPLERLNRGREMERRSLLRATLDLKALPRETPDQIADYAQGAASFLKALEPFLEKVWS
ncbi:MAG: hypothetical protein ACRENE_01120 [Polyangiaceae bacterium]